MSSNRYQSHLSQYELHKALMTSIYAALDDQEVLKPGLNKYELEGAVENVLRDYKWVE